MNSRVSRSGLAVLGLFLCLLLAACGGGGDGGAEHRPPEPEQPQASALKCAP